MPRDQHRADSMGLALVILGVVLHVSLLSALGVSGGNAWFQFGALAGQIVGVAVVAAFRGRMPGAFWAVVTVSVTPVVAVVAPFYPQATLVVVPIVFLLVLFTSSVLPRFVARVVAVEALVVATVVVVLDRSTRGLLVAELFFVVLTLAVIHVLLVRAADAQAELVQRLERVARVDGLTGLRTRRDFEESLAVELAAGGVTSLMVVDVDHFKAINDTHGHLAGDLALQHLGRRLAAGVRAEDAVVGRLGGDELAVLLRRCPQQVALRRAEDLVKTVAGAPLDLPGGGSIELGVSIGVASAAGGDAKALYAAADAALYDAKRAGRGRAAAASTPTGTATATLG